MPYRHQLFMKWPFSFGAHGPLWPRHSTGPHPTAPTVHSMGTANGPRARRRPSMDRCCFRTEPTGGTAGIKGPCSDVRRYGPPLGHRLQTRSGLWRWVGGVTLAVVVREGGCRSLFWASCVCFPCPGHTSRPWVSNLYTVIYSHLPFVFFMLL